MVYSMLFFTNLMNVVLSIVHVSDLSYVDMKNKGISKVTEDQGLVKMTKALRK